MASSSALFIITGLFQRTVFKYNARGYRFVLLEAGHVVQNLALTSTALELGLTPLGGFHDRDIDRLLQIDGVNHSSIYMAALG
jgi:SagB-type dehydrogenase family enzyme